MAEQTEPEKPRKLDGLEKYKRKFPELFRSDVSIYPSYTRLRLTYPAVCRQRYSQSKQHKIRGQFMREVRTIELYQSTALRGIRVHHILRYGLRVPKKLPDLMTPKERSRVDFLMKNTLTRS